MVYRETEKVIARKENKRRRIISAARELVSEGGLGAVQMSSVANAAGVATGTVYRYFPSKAELVAEVFRVVTQWEVDVMAQVAATDANPSQRLEGAIATFAKRALMAPRLAYALIFEPGDQLVEAERLVFRRSYAHIIAQILKEGVLQGEFRDQPVDTAANCIVGGFAEALIGPLAPDQTSDQNKQNETVQAIVNFCLKAVAK